MSATTNGSTKQVVREMKGDPAERRPEGRDDAGKILMVMNGALVGVPSAYAMSKSLPVTAVAAVLAVVGAFTYLLLRAR